MIFIKNYILYKQKSNVCLITGLSASGKSTLSFKLAKKNKSILINLDVFEQNYLYTDDELEQKYPLIHYYLTSIEDGIRFRALNLKGLRPKHAILVGYIRDFSDWLIDYCLKDKKNYYIIEGVQVYSIWDIEKVKQCKVIIKHEHIIKCIIRRIKRDGFEGEFFKMIQWYIYENETLNVFEKMLINQKGVVYE